MGKAKKYLLQHYLSQGEKVFVVVGERDSL